VHVTLVGIDLDYVWHTNSESTSNSLVHPFSTHLSLPFKILLDNVICRFFTWHLVRYFSSQYPWQLLFTAVGDIRSSSALGAR
jgi:hypothetical protein